LGREGDTLGRKGVEDLSEILVPYTDKLYISSRGVVTRAGSILGGGRVGNGRRTDPQYRGIRLQETQVRPNIV